MVHVTYFTEVTSSWCLWAEPAWAELKQRYAGQAEFSWKIALLGADALPVSTAQAEWFYRRSGTITQSEFMLNSGWLEPGVKEYLVPNLLAEAAKDFGIAGDQVRLALTHAAVREGRKVNQWNVSLPIASAAAQLNAEELRNHASNPQVEARVRASTAEFYKMQATQRPAFVIENAIGDRAMLSGIWKFPPIAAVIDAMLADQKSYAAWAAHIGPVPTT